MSRILIIGASKGIGLAATKEALTRGYEVRAFARSASKMPLKNEMLELVDGSALSEVDVSMALAGVSAVILSLGVSLNAEMFFGPVNLFSRATEVVVSAMNQAGVSRLICVTGFGAGDSRESISLLERVPFRLMLGRVYDDKSVQEQIIRDSGLDWVIARPGILTNGPKSRYKVLESRAAWRNGIISRANVADFLVKQVEGEAYIRKAPVLA